MLYTITIQDEAGKPIPGAPVTFSRGGVVLVTMTADGKGMVSFDNEMDSELLGADVSVRASVPGYSDTGASGNALLADSTFVMQAKPPYAKYIAIGGGSVLVLGWLFSGGRKKKKVSGFFDGMSTTAKLGVVAVGGLVLYSLFRKSDNSAANLSASAAIDLATLHQQGVNPTITPTQAEDMASSLVTAFDDCGTDNAAVTNAFSLLENTADVLLLVQTYGVRDYKGCFDGDWFSDHSRNLAQALTSELSGSELAAINNTLQSKGIAYSF